MNVLGLCSFQCFVLSGLSPGPGFSSRAHRYTVDVPAHAAHAGVRPRGMDTSRQPHKGILAEPGISNMSVAY